MIWHDKNVARVFEFLDKHDISSYIERYKGRDICELMEILETEIPYKDEVSVCLFDYASEDEFIIYLREKYNIHVREEVTIRHYIL